VYRCLLDVVAGTFIHMDSCWQQHQQSTRWTCIPGSNITLISSTEYRAMYWALLPAD